ncbi:putative histamine N-monooxygenase [Snodgrassella sp. ESL0253]|uniref:putative histamine N-monooxygenase n=1 Tax=Snodgrassella sp. ESL0253 TaxID=2705031 RepID=UPI001931C59D|nr:putative histamine N-monooxygenase [Snodgrassella sp. ESL0253]
MDMKQTDLAGVGIGPFNLGLAALLSSHPEVNAVFLDKAPTFHWHAGLLLPGTTLQVPFLADLVTMANPCHPLSYLNYLHQHQRLYQFCYYDRFLIPRQEYDDYCRWAVSRLPSCHFDACVTAVSYDCQQEKFIIESESAGGEKQVYCSRDIAIGIGTQPYQPEWLKNTSHPLIQHSAQFTHMQEQLQQCRQVTVVGAGQSAAECVLTLYRALQPEQIKAGASIRWITRSAGFHPMEFSKLGQECFTPVYMQYFQTLPAQKRREISASQGQLYKGISFATIGDIYDLLYERTIAGAPAGLTLFSNCDVQAVEVRPSGVINMTCLHTQLNQQQTIQTDAIVAATGYHHQWPDWFEALKDTVLQTDDQHDYLINEDFTAVRCDGGKGRIFIQNAEIAKQGVGSPDLGMGATRNGVIINQLLGKQHYQVPEYSAFQRYGLPQ